MEGARLARTDPEVRRKLIDGLHAEVGTRTVSDLEAQRDEILLGLLELRARHETPAVTSQRRLVQPEAPDARRKRIVIVGGGFAGVAAARALKRCDADVVVIDRRNHHIFQPLLYQVATAVLAPSEIAAPIRQLAYVQKNVSVHARRSDRRGPGRADRSTCPALASGCARYRSIIW